MKRLFILLPVFVIFFSACNAINTHPLDSVTLESYFKNESELMLFSNTFYSDLLDCDFDEQSDVLVCLTLSNVILGGSNRTVPSTGGGWTWTVLRKINTLLDCVDQCDDKEAAVKYTAISRFFRAYFYFIKVRYFGDVPWYDTQLESDSPDLYKPRDSREYVMTKMIEDVDYAIENLENETNCYRIDKWAALALKSRFCLFEGTFRKYHGVSYEEHDYNYYLQQAADAAYEIMTEGPFKLFSTGDPDNDYLTLFSEHDADAGEYILAICYDYDASIGHNATAFSVSNYYGHPGFTRRFVCSYLMADGSRFTDKTDWTTQTFETETADRDPRMYQSMRTQGYHRIGQTEVVGPDFDCSVTGYQPVKYVQDPNDNIDSGSRSFSDLPVFRLGEVYLNYAEAKAELGTLTQNDIDISINLLRDRVGMVHLNMSDANNNPDWYLMSEEYGYPNVTGQNQGIILEIRRERTIELVMEGFRWWDLVRWKCGPCLSKDFFGMYFPSEGEYDLTGDGVPDLVLYLTQNTFTTTGVSIYRINTDLYLSGDSSGYVYPHKNITNRYDFDEERDYFYPIPANERLLNPNLTQNPGWNDGLDF